MEIMATASDKAMDNKVSIAAALKNTITEPSEWYKANGQIAQQKPQPAYPSGYEYPKSEDVD